MPANPEAMPPYSVTLHRSARTGRPGNPGAKHFQTPEITKPLVSFETRGFVYIEFGGEGEIRNYPQSDFQNASARITRAAAMQTLQKIGILSPMAVPWDLHHISARRLEWGEKRHPARFMLRHGKKVILVIPWIYQ